MRFDILKLGVLVGCWSIGVKAACSSNLLIDNYANYANNLNSLGQWTSDDGSTTALKADIPNKKITFTSKTNSYFYTTFDCATPKTDKYTAITFPIKGPGGASFTLELQASTSCSTTAYKSYFTTIMGMTGSTQTITVGLDKFVGANLDAVRGFVWGGFSGNGGWEIGQTQFVCGSGGSTIVSSSSKTSTSSKTSSTVTTTSKVSTLTTSTRTTTSSTSTSSKSTTSSSKSSSTSVTSSSKTSSSSTTSKSTSTSTTLKTSTTTTTSSSLTSTGTCSPYLLDDFASQSRLTFLFYNALLLPSSDDGTMKPVSGRADTSTSVIVSNNHLTLTPANTGSYWYTMMGCLKASGVYTGVGMTISAPAGTTLTVELQTEADCGTANPVGIDVTSTNLGWVFDGTERYYTIPFSKFSGLDTNHLISLLVTGLSKPITLGPIALYCGSGTPYPIPTTVAVIEPSSTIPATVGPSTISIDKFTNKDTNALGFFHGGDETSTYSITNSKLTINMKGNADLSWYTQLTNGCLDFTANDNSYLHISFTGSNAFTIALQQHNSACNPNLNPYPQTWDSVEASRYSNTAKTEIYIPLTHFNINRKLAIGFALKGFYTSNPTTISIIEIVPTVPPSFLVPSKLPTAPLVFACTRPNSFAFAIDDGDPALASQVVNYIAAANIKVTFFTVGAALLDSSNGLANIYKGMLSAGHQVAYHSHTHPPMEGLSSLAAIDWELTSDIAAVSQTLGITSSYFRPPFGTEGARVRQRLAALVPGAKFVEWSVDCQDWLWAMTSTPQKQLDAFKADVDKGGNLVVMHYLYQSTVDYLPQFITIAKNTGKQLMRVDQCLEDPNAPPL